MKINYELSAEIKSKNISLIKKLIINKIAEKFITDNYEKIVKLSKIKNVCIIERIENMIEYELYLKIKNKKNTAIDIICIISIITLFIVSNINKITA